MNREYYEDELDNNPENKPFAFTAINQSIHLRMTEDL
jgi:hypothetical protein